MVNIGLVVKNDAAAARKADEFERWLKKRHVGVLRKNHGAGFAGDSQQDADSVMEELFCVFVLGGDGTFLSAVRWIGEREIPIIGVKFGAVGFLAEMTEENLLTAAAAILDGRFQLQKRMRFTVTVMRDGRAHFVERALNDVVINKGALARLAHIETHIDGHYLTTYRADGLIVATPTGSTAYSLAAGGPIIHPAVAGIVLTPICPFTLTNRPLIVPDSVTISIRLAEKADDIMLTVDGQAGFDIRYGDEVRIEKGKNPVQMIALPGQQYYDVLKAKLRWSGGRV